MSTTAPKAGFRVLLVEDSPDHVVLTRSRLAGVRPPWDIDSVETLSEALERLAARNVDVVLLDLQLPDARGLEAVNRVCGAFPEVPVVVLTSHQDEAMGVVAVQKGAQDYLVKTQIDKHGLDRSLRYAIERMRAVEALARWAVLVEASDDAIVNFTLDGAISSWNSGASRVYGHSVEEVVGRPFTLLVPPEGELEARELMARVLRGERVERLDTVHRRKDGAEVRLTLTMSPIRGAAGRILGATALARPA